MEAKNETSRPGNEATSRDKQEDLSKKENNPGESVLEPDPDSTGGDQNADKSTTEKFPISSKLK